MLLSVLNALCESSMMFGMKMSRFSNLNPEQVKSFHRVNCISKTAKKDTHCSILK